MIQIQAWQVHFHLGKLDLGLLVRMDKLKGILKLYTVITPVFTLGKPSFFEKIQAVACKCRERKYIPVHCWPSKNRPDKPHEVYLGDLLQDNLRVELLCSYSFSLFVNGAVCYILGSTNATLKKCHI